MAEKTKAAPMAVPQKKPAQAKAPQKKPVQAKTPQKKAASPKKRSGGWLKGQFTQKPLPIWILVLADVLLLGVSLIVFALFHHVIPRKWESEGIRSQRSAAVSLTQSAPASTPVPVSGEAAATETDLGAAGAAQGEATPAPEIPAEDPVGYFGTKFADKFTTGEVITDGLNYQSANVNVKIDSYDEQGVKFYVADIYVKDIEYLRTAFAKDTYGKAQLEWPDAMSKRLGGIVAINGDFYGMRTDNVVIRNGELYRREAAPTRDICVLYWDGTMITYSPKEFDMDTAMANGAYQAWNFGPMLLDSEGNAMTKFNSDVNPKNPRTAIGFYEPGHYCFVVVDGRSKESAGLTLQELSKLMNRLGCKQAYNFDGGQTSMMVAGALVVNDPDANGRTVSDIVLVVDALEDKQ